jgi:sulfatase maturation enzyme AslB (radical SAM superfamily)
MFDKTFCSSPWFHLKLKYDGTFVECRWGDKKSNHNFTTSIMQFYNSEQMSRTRTQLLNGEKPDICETCYYEETFGKLNGRIRQLNKSGIDKNNFALTTRSSPHYKLFEYSQNNNGQANYEPVDLQIDLGNICNSACIMCDPFSSSRLTSDYNKLSKTHPLFPAPTPYKSWTQDPTRLDKFVNELIEIKNLKYIHFLGGETLYDPAFYTICEKLIDAGISKNITIGTTTNGTIYDDRVARLINEFGGFHLGISIESVTPINDYVRYPGKLIDIIPNIDKFLALRKTSNLFISLRITPNIFTIYDIDLLIRYMLENQVIAESCNILQKPAQLRMELLPDDIRQEIIAKLKKVIKEFKLEKHNIVNVRVTESIKKVISDITYDYLNFLETYSSLADEEELRHKLVNFLKGFESLRENSILDYAPRYKEFLRSYGY